MVSVAWRRHTGSLLGSFIGVHVVTVLVAIVQVRITMVRIRAPPGMGIEVVEMMEPECT